MSDFAVAIPLMRRAIYPGSFDPVTNGHLDVIERARNLFDEVVVAVAHNDEKQPLFSLKERLDLLRETAGRIDNVRIAEFKGLLVEFANAEKAGAVIRGLRAVSDFEFEFQMALMNRKLDAAVETILDRKSTRLNSSHSQISYAVFCLKKKNNQYQSPYSQYRDVQRQRPTAPCRPMCCQTPRPACGHWISLFIHHHALTSVPESLSAVR